MCNIIHIISVGRPVKIDVPYIYNLYVKEIMNEKDFGNNIPTLEMLKCLRNEN